jgi:AmiR/NasT family two-component response regulator
LVHDDYEHAIDLVVEIRSYAEIPVVLLARSIDDDFLRMAADHSLEVLHLPSEPETVATVIQLATGRHEEIQKLTHQIGEMDGILERRTSVEQAKGILMERHGVDDNEAFRMLREHARANQLRVVDVAASIIAVRDLLPAPAPARTD